MFQRNEDFVEEEDRVCCGWFYQITETKVQQKESGSAVFQKWHSFEGLAGGFRVIASSNDTLVAIFFPCRPGWTRKWLLLLLLLLLLPLPLLLLLLLFLLLLLLLLLPL